MVTKKNINEKISTLFCESLELDIARTKLFFLGINKASKNCLLFLARCYLLLLVKYAKLSHYALSLTDYVDKGQIREKKNTLSNKIYVYFPFSRFNIQPIFTSTTNFGVVFP